MECIRCPKPSQSRENIGIAGGLKRQTKLDKPKLERMVFLPLKEDDKYDNTYFLPIFLGSHQDRFWVKSLKRFGKYKLIVFEAYLVALSCSEPPSGFARWSLRLLADKVVELNYIESISHETICRVLKKTELSHGGSRGG